MWNGAGGLMQSKPEEIGSITQARALSRPTETRFSLAVSSTFGGRRRNDDGLSRRLSMRCSIMIRNDRMTISHTRQKAMEQ